MSRVQVPIRRSHAIAAMMIIGLLFIPMVASLIPQGPTIYPRYDGTIDPYLDLMISEHSEEDVFRSLVQFRNWPIDDDIRYSEDIGLDHIATMKVIPAALLEGTKAEFEKLSGYPRTYWMEYDGDLELLRNPFPQ